MSNYDNGSKGLSKIALGFIGTFLSLLLAFIAKDYICKAGYIWMTDDTQSNYQTILKNVVDDDVFRRVRSADNLPNVDNKNLPTSSNKEHLRMQSLLNNLGPSEKIIKE